MQTILSLSNLHPPVWQTIWQILRLFFYYITDFQVTLKSTFLDWLKSEQKSEVHVPRSITIFDWLGNNYCNSKLLWQFLWAHQIRSEKWAPGSGCYSQQHKEPSQNIQ